VSDFKSLGLCEALLRALSHEGYEHPTSIQQQAIPPLLQGRDLLGIAQTGTGKTAAFALPLLQYLTNTPAKPRPRHCRALILAPTRELAVQIAASIKNYGRFMHLTHAIILGGVSIGPQIKAVAAGVDILIATPGRLLDLVQNQHLHLNATQIFVLDEADHMLDLGFIHPIRQIIKMLPKNRQNLFFSATMPKTIAGLADDILTNPIRVQITPIASTAERITQHVILCSSADKRSIAAELLRQPAFKRTIIFTRTKHGADKVQKFLTQHDLPAVAIHGNKSQNQRQNALELFRRGQAPILVATDIAARGIDVEGVTHVINFDLPDVAETYVHRIGRTARAGAEGAAYSLCSDDERPSLRAIEKLTHQNITPIDRRTAPSTDAPSADQKHKSHRQPHPRTPSQQPKTNAQKNKAPHRQGQHSSSQARSAQNTHTHLAQGAHAHSAQGAQARSAQGAHTHSAQGAQARSTHSDQARSQNAGRKHGQRRHSGPQR
jgi:ATP-dependent RNA helicase RhlE